MPGAVQVSVLDLMGLPSSSVSVKVSMGKREHQVWEKGEFSFPLTTLRDNLIVTLYDTEGNELSRTGVNTKLVVEKGIWDGWFPLEGGGHLHMKLQFILSDEERKRIRDMRETALKKKQDELQINWRPEGPAAARLGHHIVAAFNHEREAVSVAGRSLHDHRTSSPANHDIYQESGPEYREDIQFERQTPNGTGRRERAPSEAESIAVHEVLRLEAYPLKEHDIYHDTGSTQHVVTRIATQSPANGVITRTSSFDGAVHYLKTSNKETDTTKGISSDVISSEECNDPHLTEASHKVPAKTDTWSPPIDITTGPNSSQNQVHSTIPQIAWEITPKINETHKEGTPKSSETARITPMKIGTQSTPNDITTRLGSPQYQIHSATKKISSEKTHNKTDREGTFSMAKMSQELQVFSHTKTTQQVIEKMDIQSFPNAVNTRFTFPKEALGTSTSLLDEKDSLSFSTLEEERSHSAEDQTAPRKTPRNVRTMISAFESNHPQEPPPSANNPKMKPHINKIMTEVSPIGARINEAKTENTETKKQKLPTELKSYSIRISTEVNAQQDVSNLNKVISEVPTKGPRINGATMEDSETRKQVIEREVSPFSVMKPLEVDEHQSLKVLNARPAVEENTTSEHADWNTEHTKKIMSENKTLDKLEVTSEAEVATVSERVLRDPVREEHDQQTIEAPDTMPISQNSSQFEVLNAIPAVDKNTTNKKENTSRHKRPLDRLLVTSEADAATISERVLHDPVREELSHQTVKTPDTLPISQSSRQLEVSNAMPAEAERSFSSEQVDCNAQHSRENVSSQETVLAEFGQTPEGETATVSGRIVVDPTSLEHTRSANHVKQSSYLEKNGWETYEHDEVKVNPCRTSLLQGNSPVYLGVEESPNEVLGTLSDERRLCITTGSLQIMEFVGNQREISLSKIGVEKEVAMDSDDFVKVNEEETPNCSRDLEPERSKDDIGFGGFVGQATKIALMVAFGTLVIVTRQGKNS